MLVYLLSPSASALQTQSKKLRMDSVGLFAITDMIDSTHVTLISLDGQQVNGIYKIARLKPCFIRTDDGNTNSIDLIRQLFNSSTTEKETKCKIVDENRKELNIPTDAVRYIGTGRATYTTAIFENKDINNDIAANKVLSKTEMCTLVQETEKFPSDSSDWIVIRTRFVKGM